MNYLTLGRQGFSKKRIFRLTEPLFRQKSALEKVAKNEETASKSVGFIKKAIQAVIDLIKRIFGAISDFVRRCTMSGDERDAFNAFKKAIADDPSLKNKKVSVKDFRKINAEYDTLIKEIDQNIRAVKNNGSHPIDALVKKVSDYTKGAVGAASVIVTAETALKMADSNVGMAKVLSTALSIQSPKK